VQKECENGLVFARRVRLGLVIERCGAQLGLILTLRGLTATFGCLDHEGYSELDTERRLANSPNLVLAEFYYWTRKLQAHFFAGDLASAVDASLHAGPLLWTSAAMFESAEYRLYGALAHAAIWDHVSPEQRPRHFDSVLDHHRQLQVWAEVNPETFEDRAALVGAEIARIEGRVLNAQELYDKAIREAHKYGFVHNQAIANEIAGRFYAERGYETIAATYLRAARACYLRWGADGKVRQLEALYPHLKVDKSTPDSTATIVTPIEQLDLATVIRVSEAVSGEIVFEKLINTLMSSAIEHAGADRGLLILSRGDEYGIEAVATTGKEAVTVSQRQASITSAELPESVLRYVIRTHEAVIIDDVSVKNPFSMDDYIARRNIRSALCLPLLKQTKLIGILYLENNLTPYAFTGRIGVLRIVASQAAISLENARLYAELQNAEAYLAEAQRISHTGSFGWSATSGKLYWSDETFRIFGVDRRTKPTLDLIFQRTHPSDVDALRQLFDRARSNAADWTMERRLLMPDGLIKHVRVVAHATKDELEEVEFVGTIMDVTQSKQAEEALHKAQAELQRSARLTTMGELAATIAHELKQPLSAMILRAGSGLRRLDRAQPDVDKAKAELEEIAADGHRAGRIIESIRASFKKGTQARTALDVNELIVETLAFAHADLQQHRITVHSERTRELPQIKGDRVQLQQVLLNLITNAIESMSAVSNHRVLRVSSELLDGVVAVSVEDTGAGISLQDVERVFEPLFTTKPTGMGMGLSICRSIIEAHGGRLWATPRQPSGSTFRFTLPADQVGEILD